MKKKLFKLVLLFFAILFIIYCFLPDYNNLEIYKHFNAPVKTINRMIGQTQYRKKWLSMENIINNNSNQIAFNNCIFTFKSDGFLNNNLGIEYKKIKTSNNILITKDSSGSNILIKYDLNNSGFLNKIENYFISRKISTSIDQLFNELDKFVISTKNIYGTDMKITTLKDSTLITIKSNYSAYPTVENIYKNIKILEDYATKNNSFATNNPMLNITENMTNDYELMVALPINKFLENNGKILAKRLLAGGNILETDSIKGGIFTVNAVFKELNNFKSDLNVISPAIPYQLLITNRSKESDTSKWVTKLIYPIF